MRRGAAAYLAALLLAAVVLVAAAGIGWLVATPDGAAWLLATVSRHSGLQFAARKVEGRLLDHLRLEGVRLTVSRREAVIDRLDLRWQPLMLVLGKVAVEDLAVSRVRILDRTPVSRQPPDLVWPKVSGLPALFDGTVERLRIADLDYRRPGEPPLAVNEASASLRWRQGVVSLDNLAVAAPAGTLRGCVLAGFGRPLLRLDLAATPARPLAAVGEVILKARFLPAGGPEQLAGKVTVRTNGAPALELSGEVGMTRHSFNLRHLVLTAAGRRGSVSGDGTLLLTATEPLLTLQLRAAGLDLAPEIGRTTALSGTVAFAGSSGRYRGRFDLVNRGGGWRAVRLAGEYAGDGAGVTLSALHGLLLDGSVAGRLEVGWRGETTLRGNLRGRNLNPAVLSPDWRGVVNFDLAGEVRRSPTTGLRGTVAGRLRESRLHGRALTGELRAAFADGTLRIARLTLQGKGFAIRGAGELDRRLDFAVRADDLALLVPGTAGTLQGEGWLRWHGGMLSGAVAGGGRTLQAAGVRAAAVKLSARLGGEAPRALQVEARLREVAVGHWRAGSLDLSGGGTLGRHTLAADLRSAGAELRLELAGAYARGSWQGSITRLAGHDAIGPWRLTAPARLAVAADRVTLSPLVITGVGGERLVLAGDLQWPPWHGSLLAEWGTVNLARLNQWLEGVSVSGVTSGKASGRLQAAERLDLALRATLAGTVTAAGKRFVLRQGSVRLDGSHQGLAAALDLQLEEGGELHGRLDSTVPARLAIPASGSYSLEWRGVNPTLLRPLLPATIEVAGLLSGRLDGTFLAGGRLAVRGSTTLAGGKVRWRRPGGEFGATLRSAALAWSWQGGALDGTVTYSLAERGAGRGAFHLPLPARLPARIDPRGELRGTLTGRFAELGLLTALFPELIRESHGELDAALRLGGTWEAPRLDGELRLTQGGGYFPSAGVQLRDVQFVARFGRDQVRIDSFQATSGNGRLAGTAVVQLQGGEVTGYRGELHGERFQAVYLPELQLLASPRLTFTGTRERLAVRGEIAIPELLVSGAPGRGAIEPSKDVVIEGAAKPVPKAAPIALDIRVRVTLGDRVLVKADGLDAQLGGSMELVIPRLDRVTSRGEITVRKGYYRTHGVNLGIVRGHVFYAGGSVSEPTLDILALRTVGEVRAGVTVGGTPRAPVIKLYSEPALPDLDILAYIVLGHPLGTGSDQATVMAQAAGLLLSTSQSSALQDQLKERLGLSTLGLQTRETTTSHMGYTPIAVAPPGSAAAKTAASGLSETMLTVGKYLTPQLYASYGRSIFTGGNLFRLRYDISKHWAIETETGTESGADIFYRIDFK